MDVTIYRLNEQIEIGCGRFVRSLFDFAECVTPVCGRLKQPSAILFLGDDGMIMDAYRPLIDSEFVTVGDLAYGSIKLKLKAKQTAEMRDDKTLAYLFDVISEGLPIGGIHLRLGWSLPYYYAGQLGYWIDEPFRGKGFAVEACLSLLPILKLHGYEKLVIGTDENNRASRRVCEKIGAVFLETTDTPEWSGLYAEGQRKTSIYEWIMDKTERVGQ